MCWIHGCWEEPVVSIAPSLWESLCRQKHPVIYLTTLKSSLKPVALFPPCEPLRPPSPVRHLNMPRFRGEQQTLEEQAPSLHQTVVTISDYVRLSNGLGPIETGSSAVYKRWFNQVLHVIDPRYAATLVHGDRHTLDTLDLAKALQRASSPLPIGPEPARSPLPLALRGPTDVTIRPERPLFCKRLRSVADYFESVDTSQIFKHDLSDLRFAVQLKRTMDSNSLYVRQSIGELFAADIRAVDPVVAVLTDLLDNWTCLWLGVADKRPCLCYKFF